MQFTFLGTASSSQLPVFNCYCLACERARSDPQYVRRPSSAMLCNKQKIWLIDSGLMDLTSRFKPTTLQGIFQTHYHADHAQGLLHLRWGEGLTIPVYGPADEQGFADLYKRPGILNFQAPLVAFKVYEFADFALTPLPLQHSKPALGYLISTPQGKSLAYLTDTCGLSRGVIDYLRDKPLQYCVLDCSYPPLGKAPKNHNDLTLALQLAQEINAEHTFLTHIDHKVDCYLMQHPQALPSNVSTSIDGLILQF